MSHSATCVLISWSLWLGDMVQNCISAESMLCGAGPARARLVMFPVTGTESSFHWSRVSGVENVVSCMNAARQIELTTKFREFSTVFVVT